jgi:S-adenosylmethionine decarboxylase
MMTLQPRQNGIGRAGCQLLPNCLKICCTLVPIRLPNAGKEYMTAIKNYQPGLHIIAKLQVSDGAMIDHYNGTRLFFDDFITRHGLCKLGEVYHDFDPGGFTGVVCLSESHISIHTWPEHQLLNFDIYLSNYERINDHTAEALFSETVAFFRAEVLEKTTIAR